MDQMTRPRTAQIDTVSNLRDDLDLQAGEAFKLWYGTGHPYWHDVAQRCQRFSSILTALIEGRRLNQARQEYLNESLEFFSAEMRRMVDRSTNAQGTDAGELLRDLHSYHRRFISAVRVLQRETEQLQENC